MVNISFLCIQALQLRKKKREECLAKKRSLGGIGNPPFLVAIVSLSVSGSTENLLEAIKSCDNEACVTYSKQGHCHISVPRFKHRYTFLIPRSGDVYAILDASKVADTLILLHSIEEPIDESGKTILSCLFAQGLPSTVHVVQGLDLLSGKRKSEVKKDIQRKIENRFPDEKLHVIDKSQDALQLLHYIGSQKKRTLTVRDRRPHLLAEDTSFEKNNSQSSEGTLKVSGYVRGHPLSVNGLIHIPGWGDFQLSEIDAATDPHPLYFHGSKKSSAIGPNNKGETISMDEGIRVLDRANPLLQESLEAENTPDPMEGEQTWPTEEEMAQAEAIQDNKKKKKKVPKGTSEYQAAWIIDSAEEEESDEEDITEIDPELQAMEDEDSENEADNTSSDEELDTVSVTEVGDTLKYDEKIDIEEEKKTLVKFREERMEQMFPDEIDTPFEEPARYRFARYRGLKSFHSSPWDPKENLPSDYARIFQFENFNRTRKRILVDEREGALPGWYVTIHIANVPQAFVDSLSQEHPLVVYGLLPHEQKMSVLNIVVKKHSSCTEPIKSKERLIFHVGYRRFSACPIFSSHSNGDKHKYEKFLRSDVAVVASMYAPIIFPPAPVLVFKEYCDESQHLVALGTVLDVNPDRIVAKRVVLSGHPFKINKKSAVVRYMFFNREDIMWFKPVELHSKYGRRGHIKEPLGTHGHMKCVFDSQLKSQDTVLMNLYKRIFPKWTYDAHVSTPPSLFQAHTSIGNDDGDMEAELFD
ncbi:pre-rRNA-processing protein TSR1 homolog [Limulus polyphemus]|uniref:Pre-rRNA-processing protein TSR1 homolog n=1 Tax=Limulus polyphemus TaxID=6850 RepID=A0ABM1T7L7_LIMPO|nr:pre-rRNA-processing protein TSR1 homolog [Limulus polyphemus]